MGARLPKTLAGVSVVALATLGWITPAQAAGSRGGTHIHLLPTRQAQSLSVNPGCVGTLSPGCLPTPLQYNGGPVEQAGSTNYAVFWEPTGSTVSSTYNSLLTRFFNDIGGSTLYGVATQYYQGSNQQHIVNSSHLGGTWVDTSDYPTTFSPLTDTDIQNEVTKALNANRTWTTGIGSQVFVFLAKGENECLPSGACSFSNFCAYHGSFTSGSQTIFYASMPYADTNAGACGTQGNASPNNDPDADAEISAASHELMESVTDPLLNAWYDPAHAEIADKCAFTYGATAPDGSNITMNGHPYIVQEEFSNAHLACSLS